MFVPERETPFAACRSRRSRGRASADRPLRISGRAGDGLYWSLRSAGASPEVAAQYLAALAGEIDVGADICRATAST